MLLIRTLRCRVLVRQKDKKPATGKPAGQAKPSLLHIVPPPTETKGPSVLPSQSATEGKGSGAGEASQVSAAGVDPGKVADRVYQLMLEEIRSEQSRGLN